MKIREHLTTLSRWLISNIAWDALKEILRWVIQFVVSFFFGGVIIRKIPDIVLARVNGIFASIGWSAYVYLAMLILLSFFIFGVISFLAPPLRWIIIYLLRNDRPNIVYENGWNALVRHQGRQLSVAVITLNNRPGKSTEHSYAYDITARLEFRDLDGNLISQVKQGLLVKECTESSIDPTNEEKRFSKIDFYPNESRSLAIAYKWLDNTMMYSYDPKSRIESKKLGKTPIRVSIVFQGENMKTTRPIRLMLKPREDRFWIQER